MERSLPFIAAHRRTTRTLRTAWSARRVARFAAPVITLAIVVGGWQAYVSLRDMPEYLVPGPGAVLARLLEDPGLFYGQGLITLTEALLGLLVGGGAAFVVAVAMAHSRALERSILPWAIVLKVTPIVAVAPMFTIWFGFGTLPKVLIAALITFFPVLVNTVIGLRAVNHGALDVLRSLHASPLEVFLKLRLPSSLPFVFASVKVGITLSLIGAVVAEWSGSGEGLGHVILLAHSNLDLPTLFAGVFALASLGIVLTGLVSLLERRLLFWHESIRDGRE